AKKPLFSAAFLRLRRLERPNYAEPPRGCQALISNDRRKSFDATLLGTVDICHPLIEPGHLFPSASHSCSISALRIQLYFSRIQQSVRTFVRRTASDAARIGGAGIRVYRFAVEPGTPPHGCIRLLLPCVKEE
ncbi:hypothetical protein, partial [Paraburkholderia caribensis]|uniref:hypothetical protein n=1 Tax=Paraburkholderia caribensis TaxID=75105 RepID=UPI00317FC6BC